MTGVVSVLSAEARTKLLAALAVISRTAPGDAEWDAEWVVIDTITRPYLLRLCRRRLGAAESAADDVCQEVYFRAYRDADFSRFGGSPDAFMAYLSRVAAHRCIDRLRRARVHAEETLDTLHESVIGVAPDAYTSIGAIHTVEDLILRFDAIGLKLTDAELTLLRAVAEDVPPAAIATQLAITKTAVGVRLHRLRAKMRKYMSDGELR